MVEPSICHICAPAKQIRDDKSIIPFERHMAFSFYDCKYPISSFVDWILGSFNSEYEIYVYSHYGGRFDEHFVLRELYVRGFSPSIIMTGNKLYEIRIKARRDLAKLIFRDSYMIVNSPLAALPEHSI